MVRFDVAKDEKLTVGGDEFQTFTIRSTTKNHLSHTARTS